MFLVLGLNLFSQTLIKIQRTETTLRAGLLIGFSGHSISHVLKNLFLDQARSSEEIHT